MYRTALEAIRTGRTCRIEPEKAIADLEQVLRLSPLDPFKFYTLTLMARAHTLCGRYSDALQYAAAALRVRPNFAHALIEQPSRVATQIEHE